MDAVISDGNLDPVFIRSDTIKGYKNKLQYIFDNIYEPFDLGMNSSYLINLKARENGFNILLDGMDGDLAINQGPEILKHLFNRGNYVKGTYYSYSMARFYEESKINYIWQYGIKTLAPKFVKKIWHNLQNSNINNKKLEAYESYINSDFYIQNIKERTNHHDINLLNINSGSDKIRLEHFVRLNSPFIPVALERYDRLASLCSIEPRHPLLDIRLLNFCLAIPFNQKI